MKICDGLGRYLHENRFANIQEIVGKAWEQRYSL